MGPTSMHPDMGRGAAGLKLPGTPPLTPPTTPPTTPQQLASPDQSQPQTPRSFVQASEPSSAVERSASPSSPMSPQNVHARGGCRPCAYFRHKADGCRQGNACSFCHLCDPDAIKRIKKAKRQRMRALDRAKSGSITSMSTAAPTSPACMVDLDTSPLASPLRRKASVKRTGASFGNMTAVQPPPVGEPGSHSAFKGASSGNMTDEQPLPVDELGGTSPFKLGEPARIELTPIGPPPGLCRPYVPLGVLNQRNTSVSAVQELKAADQGLGLGVAIYHLPAEVSGHGGERQSLPASGPLAPMRLQDMHPEQREWRLSEDTPVTVVDMFPELRFRPSQPQLTPTEAGTLRALAKADIFDGVPSYFPGSMASSIDAKADIGPWPTA